MKPQDLFISARDFFAVLVPGALLLLMVPIAVPDQPSADVLRWLSIRMDNNSTLILFGYFVCAFAAGTIMGGIAASMDRIVDPLIGSLVRRSTAGALAPRWKKVSKLALSEKLARSLEEAVVPAMAKFEIGRRPWSTRAFWWNFLRLNCPAAMGELDRIEGQQKQFRSLAMGALLLAGAYFLNAAPVYGAGCVAASLALIWAYVGYRMRFARRLFELSIVYSISRDIFETNAKTFFDDNSDRWGTAGKSPPIATH